MPHPLTDWYARAQPHPSPSTFSPNRDKLVFAVMRTGMRYQSLTLALYAPDIAIDGNGAVLSVAQDDFARLAKPKLPIIDA